MPDDKILLIKFNDKFVDIMCDVNPESLEDVRMENEIGTVFKDSKSFVRMHRVCSTVVQYFLG